MNNLDLFIGWNRALFSYFFIDNSDDEEVSLYIDREKIEEVGVSNRLGGYNEFMSIIKISFHRKKDRITWKES